jgi:hypothetical protein
VKSYGAAKSGSLRFRKFVQRLTLGLVLFVERISQSADVPRLDPSPANLFQCSHIVNGIHASTHQAPAACYNNSQPTE